MKITDMNWMQVEDYLKGDDRAVVPIGSTEQRIETASLVQCYSRLLFFQACPVFYAVLLQGLPDRRARVRDRRRRDLHD